MMDWNDTNANDDDSWGEGTDGRSRAHGRISRDLFETFAENFTKSRTVKVLAAQSGNDYVLRKALEEMPALGTKGAADVAALTYYFTSYAPAGAADLRDFAHDRMDANGVLSSGEKTDFFNLLAQYVDAAEPRWRANVNHADAYGIPTVSYEGNQHLDAKKLARRSGWSDAEYAEKKRDLAAALKTLTQDWRMNTAYWNALDNWEDAGGKTAVGFTVAGRWSESGQWGHLEHIRQDPNSAPLYKALTGWLANRSGGFSVNMQPTGGGTVGGGGGTGGGGSLIANIGVITLKNVARNRFLDAESNNNVRADSATNNAWDKHWKFLDKGNGRYALQNRQ